MILKELLESPCVVDVKLSAIESYGHNINRIECFDLFDPENQSTHWSKKVGNTMMNVEKVSSVSIKDSKDAIEKTKLAQKASHFAPTGKNPDSSRGHTVFIATITMKPLTNEDDSFRTAHFVIVDCAGSEGESALDPEFASDIEPSELKHRRLEAGCINNGLSQLHLAFKELIDHLELSSFQGTGLRRILHPYLTSRANISLLFTLSPAMNNSKSTESTLKFAASAGMIKVKPLPVEPYSQSQSSKKNHLTPIPTQTQAPTQIPTSTQMHPNFNFPVMDASSSAPEKTCDEKRSRDFNDPNDIDIDAMPPHPTAQAIKSIVKRTPHLHSTSKSHHRGWPDDNNKFSCTIPDCPQRGIKWTVEESLHGHMNQHADQSIPGDVPSDYLQAFSRRICTRCRKTVSISHARDGMHKGCASGNKNGNSAPSFNFPERSQDALVPTSTSVPESAITSTSTSANDILSHWSLPTPEAIAICPAKLLPRVPKTLRAEFAGCVSRCLQDIARDNNSKSWSRWSMLSRVLLWKKDRGGKHLIHRTTAQIKERLTRWQRNELQSLWSDFLEHSKKVKEYATRPAKPRSSDIQQNCMQEIRGIGRVLQRIPITPIIWNVYVRQRYYRVTSTEASIRRRSQSGSNLIDDTLL